MSDTDERGNPIQGNMGTYVTRFRKRRASLPYRDIPPEKMTSSPEFAQNMRSLIGAVQAHQIRLLLVTQHWLLSKDMSVEDQAQLWEQSPTFKYHEGQEDELHERFNDVTRALAQEYNLPLVDLARELPKDRRLFYDEQHVTLYGAEQFADKIGQAAEFILR